MAEMEMMRNILKVELLELKNGMVCEGKRENVFSLLIFDMDISYLYLTPWFPNLA